ncbi:hypothetical protein M4D55_02620 [Metabacillus idriensis]|uniref:Uncharacterized protein n=1 Tax=Metabacillus idriensis TaxID=324768 RepID=A0A6I2M7C3_9BACI|nr:hypothetical protein [Metabacillus idriensis]MCM3594683.1 hypothetical protein [Metabacillus idriensis]MRX53292.1 hypothetical protein [Metabacillus idriensis]OHR68617.1 hypothetical protein HMPREF3291_08800 [Bacillus sp. HMSC76G11]
MAKKIQIPSNLLTHHYIQNEKSEVKIVTPEYELNPDDYFSEELSKAFKTEAMELFYSYVRKANRTDGENEFEFR